MAFAMREQQLLWCLLPLLFSIVACGDVASRQTRVSSPTPPESLSPKPVRPLPDVSSSLRQDKTYWTQRLAKAIPGQTTRHDFESMLGPHRLYLAGGGASTFYSYEVPPHWLVMASFLSRRTSQFTRRAHADVLTGTPTLRRQDLRPETLLLLDLEEAGSK